MLYLERNREENLSLIVKNPSCFRGLRKIKQISAQIVSTSWLGTNWIVTQKHKVNIRSECESAGSSFHFDHCEIQVQYPKISLQEGTKSLANVSLKTD